MVYVTISGFNFHLQLEMLGPTETHSETIAKHWIPVMEVGVLEEEKNNSVQ